MGKNSLDTYWGGFLINAPCPLELSLNYCLHSCPECFSNLNKPDRRANVTQIFNLIDRSMNRKPKTLAQYLLHNRYPIQFSNHVDPFAGVKAKHSLNNYSLTLPILEILNAWGIPCTIQTKGGLGLLEPFNYHCSALDLLQPSVFYVSLETLDDGIGKRKSAPGAPSPSERLTMIETLIARGHRVCVGVNPVVPQWLPDPELMVSTLHGLGVEGIWIQALHLSRKQIKNMPGSNKKKLGPELLDQALVKNHKKYPAIKETLDALRSKADELGLAVYDSQQSQQTDYFKPYFEAYPNRYPMQQEFVNWCWDNLSPGDLIYWNEWADFMLEFLPEGDWPILPHIGSVAGPPFWSQARNFDEIKNTMSYEKLLWTIWHIKESVLCPVNIGCFRWAGDYEQQADGSMGWTRWLDDDYNQPILVFKPDSTEELWAQKNLQGNVAMAALP